MRIKTPFLVACLSFSLLGCSNSESSVKAVTEDFCRAAEAETENIDTYNKIVITKCSEQNADVYAKPALVLELNSFLEWVNMNDLPTSTEIDNLIFDYPLQLLVEGFRNSGLNPLDYESILIVMHEETMSVYEIIPTDLQDSINDTRILSEVLLELRNKVLYTQ